VVPHEFADADPTGATEYARLALSVLGPIARRDAKRLDELHHRARVDIAAVPLFTQDVHDLESLRELARYVVGGSTRG
jgi:hypothetical protein